MHQPDSLTHHFLVAIPTLADFNFAKSVVYIYSHTKEGALGMIINKPSQINLGNLFEHLGITTTKEKLTDLPVFMGGPIRQDNGFILYGREPASPTEEMGVTVSASKELLQKIATTENPRHFLIILGHSGWGPNQLEQEIARNDWLAVPFNAQILFNVPIEKRWEQAAA